MCTKGDKVMLYQDDKKLNPHAEEITLKKNDEVRDVYKRQDLRTWIKPNGTFFSSASFRFSAKIASVEYIY